jgi:membrane-associated protease RseP (regulator of RpoE activity)
VSSTLAERPEPDLAAPPEDRRPSNAWGLVRLAVVVAAIAAVFLVLGLGALLLVIGAILLMVVFHEFGHFVAAKWAGMKATQFFVGFGPPLWSIRRGETEYGVKPILLGGYVKIIGMSSMEDVEPEDEPRSYRRQAFHKRIIVALAGPLSHIILAVILAWVAVVAFGVASPNIKIAGFTPWQGSAQNAAQSAGLHKGDVIQSVNGHRLTSLDQLQTTIQHSTGKTVVLGVDRAGRHLNLPVVPRDGRTITSGGKALVAPNKPATGFIGIEEEQVTTPEGPLRAIGTAAITVGRFTSASVAGLGHAFSPHGISQIYSQVTNAKAADQAAQHPETSARPSSIVGIARVATQADQAGILYLLDILIVINIGLALLNLLPMLPLDGGHVAIAVYERIRTRRGQPRYVADAAKLLPVVYAFMAVLIVVAASAVFLDIAHPAANPFSH